MIKNLKYLVTLILLLGFSINCFSQSNLLNAKDPKDIGYETESFEEVDVLEYGFIDDKDILFSKMVWETIDVNQKVNFPYLYPTKFETIGQERRPLLYFIREAIGHELDTSNIYDDGNFNKKKSAYDVKNLWKIQKESKPGTESLQNVFGFITEKYQQNAKTIEGDDIFPYPYVNIETPGIDAEFTYQDFLGLYNSAVNPGESDQDADGNVLSIEKKTILLTVAQELTKKLWIENVHFEYIDFKWEDLTQWRIKGLWYFDKIQSHLKYRLIAIAPIAKPIGSSIDNTDPNASNGDEAEVCRDEKNYIVACDGSEGEVVSRDGGSDNNQGKSAIDKEGDKLLNEPKALFWLYYPHLRDILSKKRPRLAEDGKNSREPVVFSERNSSVRKTFDELLNSRRFKAVIYKEENVYQDRDLVKAYPNNSFMRLLEAERVNDKIRNLEHDMWSW
tara:strand:- start:120 stop:1460 length:1341 start_codon:yes stop_codon:yes gene_type:complete